jgi:hypothetical protein
MTVAFPRIVSTNYRVLNGKVTRTAQAPPPFVHTAPVPTFGISGIRLLVETPASSCLTFTLAPTYNLV